MPQVFLYQKCIVKDNVGCLKGLLVVETTQSCVESEGLSRSASHLIRTQCVKWGSSCPYIHLKRLRTLFVQML